MSDRTHDIQDWVDSQRNQTSTRRALDVGTYVVSDTIVVRKSMGLRLVGAGGADRSPTPTWDPFRCNTRIEWQGPPDKPVIQIVGCTNFVMQGISVIADEYEAASCILIKHGDGSLNLRFQDCGLRGGKVGIQCGTQAGEQTCANIYYDQVCFENQTEAAVRLVNAQSLQHRFEQPLFLKCPVVWDVQAGGDICSTGGGSYEVGTLLKLGNVSQNTRGFDISSLRVDGRDTRTAWLDCYDTDRARTHGVVSFRNVGQNSGQKTATRPLFTVPPGCRCVADCCDFNGTVEDWARVYSDDRTTQQMPNGCGGELYVNYSSGLDGRALKDLVQHKGRRARYKFTDCGNLYSETGSYSFPPDATT